MATTFAVNDMAFFDTNVTSTGSCSFATPSNVPEYPMSLLCEPLALTVPRSPRRRVLFSHSRLSGLALAAQTDRKRCNAVRINRLTTHSLLRCRQRSFAVAFNTE